MLFTVSIAKESVAICGFDSHHIFSNIGSKLPILRYWLFPFLVFMCYQVLPPT